MSYKEFIVFGLQPWDFEMGSNCKDIATVLSRHGRVLYVNRPIERSSLYKFKNDHKIKARLHSLKTGENVLTRQEENIWVLNPQTILESINWMPQGKLYHSISRRNAQRLASQIKKAADELKFDDPLLFIDNDFLKGFYLNDYLQTSCLVYYIRDFLLSQPYFSKHGRTLEPAYIGKANVVVTNSLYLSNYASQYNKKSFDIGQGCDVSGYLSENLEMPEDLIDIPRPLIGYCGALLSTRLDISLIEKIALAKPDWSIVLVGPEDDDFKSSKLHQMSNVHFTGSKPMNKLPDYVHQFDVCINPQVLNQMTIGNYPRKIDEYLAAGKKVVATDTVAMQMFKDFCFLAKDAETYIQGLAENLGYQQTEEDIIKRKSFAMSHSWEASVSKLLAVVNSEKITNHEKEEKFAGE